MATNQANSFIPAPRFGNGFSLGSVSNFGTLTEYENSPEIFLNVPNSDQEMWDINIVDTEGSDIHPVISCFGTRQMFHIGEQITHFDEGNTLEENIVQDLEESATKSLAVQFSPCAPPNGEVAYLEVKYKGLIARVEWQWASEDSGDVVVSDFEGKQLRVQYGKEITYHEA